VEVALVTHRKLISLALALLVCLAGSCDRTSDRGNVVTLHFWNLFTGPDGRTMLTIVKRFNDSHPGIHILMQRMEAGTYYNKLFVAGLGHRAPQVFVVHSDSIGRFLRANLLRPMDDLLQPGVLDPADFDPNVLAAVARGGRHFAVPLDIHLVGMFYNKKLFRDAGIVDAQGNPRPPTNRDEFLDALRRLKKTDRNGRVTQWGFVFTWLRVNCFTIMDQFSGRVFSDDESKCTLDSPQNIAAMQFCADLINTEHLAASPEDMDSWIGFLQGKVGITLHGVFMLADLQRQSDLDYGAAPVPMLGNEPATWCNSHNLCLRPDLSDREAQAAKTFIKFLSDNSLDWAAGGQVPVRRSLRDTERFKQMWVQREFARQIPYARYMPQVPFTNEYLAQFDLAIDKILRGSQSPHDALHQASTEIDQIIQRYHQADVRLKALAQGVQR
jgi:multiple sugar transport system substrate-binding protein